MWLVLSQFHIKEFSEQMSVCKFDTIAPYAPDDPLPYQR